MAYDANVIAKHIITHCTERKEPISNLKLQKILYFTWIDFYKGTEEILFNDDICAWQLGPVIPNVYYEFCVFGGKPIIRTYQLYIEPDHKTLLDEIINRYSVISPSRLVDMSHKTGGAWDIIYRSGKGDREIIPFSLIKRKECGD